MDYDIPELGALKAVEDTETRYSREFGASPVNLSHWDPSPQIRRRIMDQLALPPPDNPVDYIYSDSIELAPQIKARLRLPLDAELVLAPSSTSATLEMLRRSLECERRPIRVLRPHYFTITHAARLLGMQLQACDMQLANNRLRIPRDALSSPRSAALFVTNPVFSTSVPICVEDIEALNEFLACGGHLLLDESLASLDALVGPRLLWTEGVTCLYSPHKAALVNAVKFAVLACHPTALSSHLEWSDVIFGGLPASSRVAVAHFCSADFFRLTETVTTILQDACVALEEALSGFHHVEALHSPRGHFATLRFHGRSHTFLERPEMLWDLATSTGAVVFTGSRSNAPKSWRLNFRINLARSAPEFWGALDRVLRYLQ